MELNKLKSEEYIYLKVLEDFYDKALNEHYKKGTIIRYRQDNLQKSFWSKSLPDEFFENIEMYSNYTNQEDQPLPSCEKIYFKEDLAIDLTLGEGSYWLIDSALCNKLDSSSKINYQGYSLPKKIVNMSEIESKASFKDIIDCPMEIKLLLARLERDCKEISQVEPNQKLNLYLEFKKGDTLDFLDPSFRLIFLDQERLKFLQKVKVITGQNKANLIAIDFDDEQYIDEEHERDKELCLTLIPAHKKI